MKKLTVLIIPGMLLLMLFACKKETKQTQSTNTSDTMSAVDKLVGTYIGNHFYHFIYSGYVNTADTYYAVKKDTSYSFWDTVVITKMNADSFTINGNNAWKILGDSPKFKFDSSNTYYASSGYRYGYDKLRLTFKPADSLYLISDMEGGNPNGIKASYHDDFSGKKQ